MSDKEVEYTRLQLAHSRLHCDLVNSTTGVDSGYNVDRRGELARKFHEFLHLEGDGVIGKVYLVFSQHAVRRFANGHKELGSHSHIFRR